MHVKAEVEPILPTPTKPTFMIVQDVRFINSLLRFKSMDLEGYAKKLLERYDEKKVEEILIDRIVEIKGFDVEIARR
jgi:hypothetical protein